jgi:thiamine-monophosphate kinase
MIKNRKILNENKIIYDYLLKLNFNKKETFNFKNDGAILKQKKYKDIVITNDSIIESVDFFSGDSAESVAQKIVTYNLSDLSSMGASPYCYTLSLLLPKGVTRNWIGKFTKQLFYLQKKYNFFLIGGDIGISKKIHISSNFFGYVKKKFIIKRSGAKVGDSIWVTGNIGESHLGLLIKKNKIKVNKKINSYYLKKYSSPEPCMLGSKILNYLNSGIDISDGFLGDLHKLLGSKLGVNLIYSKIPFSKNTKYLIKKKIIDPFVLLNGGDDYELIFTCSEKYDYKIKAIAETNKYKISKVGHIIHGKEILLDGKKINNTRQSFQYLF